MRRVGRGRTKRTVFEQVAHRVLSDARLLLRHGRWHSAVYLSGYGVECLLKAAVCQYKGLEVLPKQLEVHDFDVLLDAARLRSELEREAGMKSCFLRVSTGWGVEMRYAGRSVSAHQASKFLNDVGRLLRWLNEKIWQRK